MAKRTLPAVFTRRQRQATHPSAPTAPTKTRRFATAGDGTKDLYEGYNAWTSGLAKHALQVTFALIGANWALYGTQAGILSNGWATASLFIAVGYLVLQLGLMLTMAIWHFCQHEYAEANRSRWEEEFNAAADTKSDWPYTKSIIRLGKFTPWLNLCAPALSGVLLFGSAFKVAPMLKPSAPAQSINSIQYTNASAVEKLGTISGFSLGDASVPTAVAANSALIVEITRRWRQEAAKGGKGVLVILGTADRVPLSSDARRRFEGNFGLASSRADAVKRAILAECLRQTPDCSLRAEQMIVLASGPVLTQAPWSKFDMATGFADDRRVDVWALWSAGS